MTQHNSTPANALSNPAAKVEFLPIIRRNIGERVKFTSKSDGTIHGTITRVNQKTVSVEPDAPKFPGQYYRVPPSMLSKSDRPAPTSDTKSVRPTFTSSAPVPAIPVGAKVSFDTRGGKTITGTLVKKNRKTWNVQPDGEADAGRYWRVSPALVRPAS